MHHNIYGEFDGMINSDYQSSNLEGTIFSDEHLS